MDFKLPFDLEFLEKLSNDMQYMVSSVNKALENTQFAFSAYLQILKKAPDSIKILANYGWYMPIDFDPVTVNRLAADLKEGKTKLVDNKLIKHFDLELLNIQKKVISNFPNRSKAVIAGFRAHKRKEYYLSIPVFFAQIEGICNELTGTRFFKIKENQPKTLTWVNKFENNSMIRILLEPLYISGPMRQSQDLNNPIGLNRHDVLHGDSLNYGDSKIVAYKVLSLMNYISETVFEAKKFLDSNTKTIK
jgi:hypothetical protein